MPAASDPGTGERPVVFRPLGVRFAVVLFGAMLVVVCAVIWFSFPAHVRAEFTFPQQLTLLFFGLVLGALGYGLARCRVEARSDGVLVVNGYRSHHYGWNDLAGVALRPGAPWATLHLADGTTSPAMGIQGSDGARATRQVQRLRMLLDQHSRDAGTQG